MSKIIHTVLVASLAFASCQAFARDNSPLAKVYPIQEMDYAYAKPIPGQAKMQAQRVESDKLIRSTEVINSGASLDLKRAAVDELATLRDPGATKALAAGYKQAQAMKNPAAESYVANAIWHQAGQMEFKNPQSKVLFAQLSRSKFPEVRLIGAQADLDAANYAKRNAR